ncbi:MAG: hypothetical protein M3065_12350 [Actinomycetota bacterium]|nr:hypothetical protein [Actinomycetota bacterium]
MAVSPLHLGVGETLTVRGKNFLAGKNRNWVVFQRARARAVFVRVDTATSTKAHVRVPTKLLPFLTRRGRTSVPTRFSLRVLLRRFVAKPTPRRLSPVIGPAPVGDDSSGAITIVLGVAVYPKRSDELDQRS